MKLSSTLSLLSLAAVVVSQSQRPLSNLKSDSLKVPGENTLEVGISDLLQESSSSDASSAKSQMNTFSTSTPSI
jgi:hypothetical protein